MLKVGGRWGLVLITVLENGEPWEFAHTRLLFCLLLSSGRVSSIVGLILLLFHLFLFLFQEHSLLSSIPILLFSFPYPFLWRSGNASKFVFPGMDWVLCNMNYTCFDRYCLKHCSLIILVLSYHPIPLPSLPFCLWHCSYLCLPTTLHDSKTFPWNTFF